VKNWAGLGHTLSLKNWAMTSTGLYKEDFLSSLKTSVLTVGSRVDIGCFFRIFHLWMDGAAMMAVIIIAIHSVST